MKQHLFNDLRRGLTDFCLRGAADALRLRGMLANLHNAYRQSPSFSDLLPWLEILENGDVLLEDGSSCAAVLEWEPVDVEGRSVHSLRSLQDSLRQLLGNSFNEFEKSPWVLQVFAFLDENGLCSDTEALAAYQRPDAAYPWREEFLQLLREHVEDICNPRGLFHDPLTDRPWRGSSRRVIACIYRRTPGLPVDAMQQTRQTLDAQVRRLQSQLSAVGVQSRRCAAAEILRWFGRWFPCSAVSPDSEGLSSGVDCSVADTLCPRRIRSDARRGIWHFDDQVQRILVLQRLRSVPCPGQLSAEHVTGETSRCLLEQMPPGCMLVLTLIFRPQDSVLRHLDQIEYAAVGSGEEAFAGRTGAQECRRRMLYGDRVYPFALAVFVQADSVELLRERYTQMDTLFLANQLQLIAPEMDPVALDAWLGHIPMGYRPDFEQFRRRNRFIYTSDAAALLPLYGRPRGSRRPGLLFFNRGGEMFACDPLNIRDRAKNAHLFVFGPTGAGKSATLVYLQMVMMAFHRPRIVAVEAGNSFALLAEFFRSRGLRTLDLSLDAGCDVSLPPFAAALHAESAGQGSRDILGELGLIARLMVTGGRAEEEKLFRRSDQAMLQDALLQAVREVRRAGADTVRVSDVCAVLRKCGQGSGGARCLEMAQAMSLFTAGRAGELFDRPGRTWEDVDYLRFEMGSLGAGQHPEQLAVAWLGLVNAVVALAERTQHDGRPMILLTDEAHVITGNPLLASYLVKISKLLGRRLGLWLWMATQNMKDFQGDAEKMLAMFEWWLCLGPGKSEISDLGHFRQLDEEERKLLQGVRKVPGKYTEGVLLSDTLRARFRSVPPALCLALAQTEKEEKTMRRQIMQERDCSELEAVFVIASQIAEHRRSWHMHSHEE